jgi:DNA polymerase III delta subunit
MIYFFHGTDTEKARVKANELADSLRKKKPDASFFRIDAENFDTTKLQEYIGGQGLFSNKYIVLLDRLCAEKEVKEQFTDLLKEIAESENIFIIFEGKIDKATATKIEKKAEKTATSDLTEKEEREIKNKKEGALNVFEIANALGEKNKKHLWIIYRQLIEEGKAPEEIHGVLFWKAKTMLLAGGSNIWKSEELSKMIEDLIMVYHEARRGAHELETGLEALLIGIK